VYTVVLYAYRVVYTVKLHAYSVVYTVVWFGLLSWSVPSLMLYQVK